MPDIYPGQYDIRRLLRAARTLNNDKALFGEGVLRHFFVGTYLENILPLGPGEDAADLRKPGAFEQKLEDVRGVIAESHPLGAATAWFNGVIESLRGRH